MRRAKIQEKCVARLFSACTGTKALVNSSLIMTGFPVSVFRARRCAAAFALPAAALLAVVCLDSCHSPHRLRGHGAADPVAATRAAEGAPITAYYCDQAAVRLWLRDKLDFGKLRGVPLNKKEAQAVRRCIAAIRATGQPWPPCPQNAATEGRYLFVSGGQVIFSIFGSEGRIQYPLTQTNPALWAKTHKTLEHKLREAASPQAPKG